MSNDQILEYAVSRQIAEVVLDFHEKILSALVEFDEKMPSMPWSHHLGSSASSLADELLDKAMKERGYCSYGQWIYSELEQRKESEQESAGS